MDKRKTRKGYIELTLAIVIIIIFSVLTISYYTKYQSMLEDNNKLNKDISLIDNTYSQSVISSDTVLKEINDLENIDQIICDTKTDVFTLAKKLEDKIIAGNSEYKIAYLTFDDGPYYLTDSYLKVLKDNKIKATFFTIGLNKDTCFDNKKYSCKETYKKIVDGGHTIANHTYSHLIFNGLYKSSDSFIQQVKKQEDLIKTRTGVTTNIVRFPGGSASARKLKNSMIEKLRENNYGWVDWTAGNGDGGYVPNYNTAWSNFTKTINEDIEVVLFHDYNKITLQMLPQAIKYLQDNNYILLPLFYESVKINK